MMRFSQGSGMPTGTIESLDHEARGITRLEGKTIFVDGVSMKNIVRKDGIICYFPRMNAVI